MWRRTLGATMQDPLVRHRQALAWGQQVCTQLLQTWTALEAAEAVTWTSASQSATEQPFSWRFRSEREGTGCQIRREMTGAVLAP